ncbi:MAG: 16S rRNA (guanine(966)-N(2))-methyltransferase RsmD [Verrucomicrobiota bacterium]
MMSRIRIIAGTAKGLYIQSPKKFTSRPTQERVREALFSSIAPRIPAASFLDLYAGSGSVGIEALSRGVASATFVEIERRYCKTIQANLNHCSLTGRIFAGSAAQFLSMPSKTTYDIIFADPPYNQKTTDLNTLPLASELHDHLNPHGTLIWEHDSHSQWNPPAGLEITKVRKIGQTCLTYMQPVKPH